VLLAERQPRVATRTTVSDEEIQLRKRARRRLVGAVALVVVVVAAVPMVLDREPKRHDGQIEVRIPPVPPAPSSTAAAAPPPAAAHTLDAAASAPLAAPPPASPPAQTSTPGVVERAPEPQPAAPQSAPPPGATAGAAPDAAAKPAAHASARTAARDGYVVPLIATSSPAKARELRQKLERQKFPAYLEKTPDGGKTRVRVGPYDSREAAERARQRLVKLAYDPGKVVRRGD
jgi:DedD protein